MNGVGCLTLQGIGEHFILFFKYCFYILFLYTLPPYNSILIFCGFYLAIKNNITNIMVIFLHSNEPSTSKQDNFDIVDLSTHEFDLTEEDSGKPEPPTNPPVEATNQESTKQTPKLATKQLGNSAKKRKSCEVADSSSSSQQAIVSQMQSLSSAATSLVNQMASNKKNSNDDVDNSYGLFIASQMRKMPDEAQIDFQLEVAKTLKDIFESIKFGKYD
jgi:hypothetical protein